MDRYIGIVFIVVLLGGSIIMLTSQNDTPEQKNIAKKNPKPKKKPSSSQKKDIQIVYMDEKEGKNSPSLSEGDKKAPMDMISKEKNTYSDSENSPKNDQYAQDSQKDLATEKNIIKTPKKIKEFVTENALQKLPSKNKKSGYAIYAKNTLDNIDMQQYEDKPPMVPTIITKKTSGGKTFSVVVDTRVVQNNDTIYIAKEDEKGEPQELIKVPIKIQQDNLNETANNQEEQQSNVDKASKEQENSKSSENDIRLIMPPSF